MPAPPELIHLKEDDELEYKVKEILDSHTRWKQLEYLVKWKGYNASHNSWEPAQNLEHALKIINKFYKRYPKAAQI